MLVGSLFSGAGGLDLGLEEAGMDVRWMCEKDRFCRQVLRRQWPDMELYGDVEGLNASELPPVDLVCGGFPCTDISKAGPRTGLAGKRSGLFFEFLRIVAELSPRWILIENVPGLLSSNDGRDMGTVLRSLGDLGFWWAYRLLDAQWFGVGQERRRVFIVGSRGTRSGPTEVLLEPEGLPWDPPPGEEMGKDDARGLHEGPRADGKATVICHQRSQTILSNPCYDWKKLSHLLVERQPGDDVGEVRRLTSEELERLQGFPTGWTATGINQRGEVKELPELTRLRLLGNAVCVPVARWIGERILEVDGR